ncbi:hypothetical protein MADA3029_340007 [Vibrio nigripulchritudo MADA3029]|nr:hypothetical protein VIBNIMADA3020_1260007 [Vibrio nigripulchritudo MADA3020]CCN59063.1 hypothetical protein MADA3029_340007 [Vibrio nigripulchritudo MADA3029]
MPVPSFSHYLNDWTRWWVTLNFKILGHWLCLVSSGSCAETGILRQLEYKITEVIL